MYTRLTYTRLMTKQNVIDCSREIKSRLNYSQTNETFFTKSIFFMTSENIYVISPLQKPRVEFDDADNFKRIFASPKASNQVVEQLMHHLAPVTSQRLNYVVVAHPDIASGGFVAVFSRSPLQRLGQIVLVEHRTQLNHFGEQM